MNIPYISVNITELSCFSLMLVTFLAAKKTPELKSFLLVLVDWRCSVLNWFSIILSIPFPTRKGNSC